MLALKRDDEFDLMRASMRFELFGLLADKILKDFEREPVIVLAGLLLRAAKCCEEFPDLLPLVIGIFAGNGKRELCRRFGWGSAGPSLLPLFLKLPGCGPEMTRHNAFFPLPHALTEDFPILCVHLDEVAVSEALGITHFRAPITVTLNNSFDSPLDIGRRPGFPSAKILFVLDLQLTNVLLQMAQVFVNRSDKRFFRQDISMLSGAAKAVNAHSVRQY
jgi:hypothetical protein